MSKKQPNSENEDQLSRRERQIMDIIYSAGEASARTVLEKLPDAPSYATVRTLLRILVEKDQLQYRVESRSFIYAPKQSRDSVAKKTLQRILKTFYGGSIEQAIAGLLDPADQRLEPEEIERIEKLLKSHKQSPKQ